MASALGRDSAFVSTADHGAARTFSFLCALQSLILMCCFGNNEQLLLVNLRIEVL